MIHIAHITRKGTRK